MAVDQLKVAIFGSCVSRDALEMVGDSSDLTVTDYYSRSSLASAFHPTPAVDRYSHTLQSKFQQRQVQRDFQKTFAQDLHTLEFDILLIDFTDDRFRLFGFESGAIITVSAELGKSAFPDGAAGNFIAPYSDAHVALWESGWKKLVSSLRDQGRLEKLRINHALWAMTLEDGTPFSSPFPPASISKANAHLERLANRAAEDLAPWQVYRYDPELSKGNSSHKWGAAPFHLHDRFYLSTIEKLRLEL